MGHVNPMKTGFVTALLLLGTLVPMTTALADPIEEAVALATAVAACAASAIDPQGEVDVVDGRPQQTIVDTHPVCLN